MQVADGVQTAQKSLTITVNAVLTVTTASLPNGVQGTPYSQTLTATGGTGTNTWSLASGTLPAGLALSTAGVISGTPTATGSTFTVQVSDGVQTAQKSLTITVNAVLTITTVSLPNGVQGTPYSQTLTATGGTGTNTWTLASGSLPAGIGIVNSGCDQWDANGDGIDVYRAGKRRRADGAEIPDDHCQRGADNHDGIAAERCAEHPVFTDLDGDGGTGSNTWSLATGSLPTGLTLSAAGVISGTPSGTGTTFTVRVADGVQTAQKSLTITISTALVVATVSLPNGVQGTAYSQTLTATGGTGSNTWSLATGTLPAGLSLSAAGVISGTPTGTGLSTFTVQVTDGVQTAQKSLTITVNAVLTITTTSLPDAVQGIAYSQTLAATGGTGTNTWSLATGSLPTGLTLSAAGVISGTPTATGTTFTVQVTDSIQTKQQSLTIAINAVLTVTTASLPNGVQGTAYSQTLTATGGTGTKTWSLASGTLPVGLSLSAAGVISGTPTGSGASTFTAQVTDGVQTAQKSLTITVNLVLTITTASLPNGVQGTPYSQTLTTTGGTGSNTWSVATGSLPTGLTLSAAGVISGTPTGTGTASFTVQAADGVQTAQKPLTINVNAVLTITTSSLVTGIQGTTYSQTLAATGGTGSNTWSLATGSLPTGLTLSATGVISGTPTAPGTTFTVRVTDGAQTAQKSLTLNVVPPLDDYHSVTSDRWCRGCLLFDSGGDRWDQRLRVVDRHRFVAGWSKPESCHWGHQRNADIRRVLKSQHQSNGQQRSGAVRFKELYTEHRHSDLGFERVAAATRCTRYSLFAGPRSYRWYGRLHLVARFRNLAHRIDAEPVWNNQWNTDNIGFVEPSPSGLQTLRWPVCLANRVSRW